MYYACLILWCPNFEGVVIWFIYKNLFVSGFVVLVEQQQTTKPKDPGKNTA